MVDKKTLRLTSVEVQDKFRMDWGGRGGFSENDQEQMGYRLFTPTGISMVLFIPSSASNFSTTGQCFYVLITYPMHILVILTHHSS